MLIVYILLQGMFLNRIRADLSRSLALPNPDLCRNRTIHYVRGRKEYSFSWKFSDEDLKRKDWLGSRNFCRERCMDSLSVETPEEWNSFIRRAVRGASEKDFVTWIWTSGRLCDFDGCEKSKHVKPVNIKGWFWSGSNQKISPSTCIPGFHENCFHRWSNVGKYGFAQPDNREYREYGIDQGNESCLAILLGFKTQGGKRKMIADWHDRACYYKTFFVCEDSKSLRNYAARIENRRRSWNQKSRSYYFRKNHF